MEWYVQVIIVVCYLIALVGAGFLGYGIAKIEEKKDLEIIHPKSNKLRK